MLNGKAIYPGPAASVQQARCLLHTAYSGRNQNHGG